MDINSTLIDPATSTMVTEASKFLFNKIANKIKNICDDNNLQVVSYCELAEQFSEYLWQNYEKYKSIPTIALRDAKVLLESIYQPLSIIKKDNDKEEYLIIEYNEELFDKYSKMLIIDSAGMGKSTLSQFLFLSALRNKAEIPIFIELRSLKDGKKIIDELYNKFNYLSEGFKKAYLIELIKKGDFIFFFDGYDEITNTEKDRVTLELKEFISNAGENKFIITSRPIRSANFPNFDKFEIKNMNEEEAFNLIKKYDSVSKLNLHDSLVESIKSTNGDYSEFLANPLYVSLLYLTYKRKRELPTKQSEFYRQVFEALYMEHDLTKDGVFKRQKDSGLSMDELIKFLGRFAYVSLLKNLNDYNSNQIINLINETINFLYYKKDIEPSILFNDLTENVPLFVRQGVNYKWVHKSFMEYFASIYISIQESKIEILEYIKDSEEIENYENMLHIYADIDKQNFDNVFIKPYLMEYLRFMDSWKDDTISNTKKSGIFGHNVFITRLSKDTIKKISVNLETDKKIKSQEYIDNIDDETHKKELQRERNSLLIDIGTSKIYKGIKLINERMTMYGLLKNGSMFFICTCTNPFYEMIHRLADNKGYEFIEEYDKYFKAEFFLEMESVQNFIQSLNFNKEINSIIDYNEIKNVQNKNLKLLLLEFSTSYKVINYEIAKDYYDILKLQEEKISDILSLLI